MPRRIVIHKSLYRPILFVGCERLPFTLLITIGGMIIMSYQSLLISVNVLVFYIIGIMAIRRINTDDPQFFRCLFRYVRYYADYYPANAFYPGRADRPQNHFE